MDYPTQQMPIDQMAGPSASTDEGGRELAYCIEIYVYQDGTFRVAKESAAEEGAQHAQTGTKPGEGGKDVDSPGQALQAALEIMRGNPVGQDGQEQFQAGFEAR